MRVYSCGLNAVRSELPVDIDGTGIARVGAVRFEGHTKQDNARLCHIDFPRLLSAFKRIRKNARNGLAVVYIQRDSCGGCFNRIPPQRQLDIKMRKKIIVCEYCGRIMIDPELAGVQIEHKVEEAPVATTKRAIRRKTAE